MAIDFMQFFFNFIIAGLIWSFLKMKLAGTDIGNALAFIH